jgi:hypothetical protein
LTSKKVYSGAFLKLFNNASHPVLREQLIKEGFQAQWEEIGEVNGTGLYSALDLLKASKCIHRMGVSFNRRCIHRTWVPL